MRRFLAAPAWSTKKYFGTNRAFAELAAERCTPMSTADGALRPPAPSAGRTRAGLIGCREMDQIADNWRVKT
jgi:hypothetical protein